MFLLCFTRHCVLRVRHVGLRSREQHSEAILLAQTLRAQRAEAEQKARREEATSVCKTLASKNAFLPCLPAHFVSGVL